MFLFYSFVVLSQSYLEVENPQNPWLSRDNGTIEELQFTFQPRGLYTEMGMYITFSARDTDLALDTNFVEVDFNFSLTEGSMITDSWLWIGDDIIQAAIEERWAAWRQYEEIVGRVFDDPSLLTKDYTWDGKDHYSLKIYPMQSDSSRRVKITSLIPNQWSNGKALVQIPFEIIKASKNPIEKVSFISQIGNGFSNPRLVNTENRDFRHTSHKTLGDQYFLELQGSEVPEHLVLEYDVKMDDGVYITNYNEDDKNYYQYVLIPEQALPTVQGPRNVLVLIDYDSTYTNISFEQIMNSLEHSLISELNDEDQFNLMFSSDNIQLYNPTWISGHEESIRIAFNALEESPPDVEVRSQFPAVLKTGLESISSDSNTSILLISANADFGYFEDANDLIGRMDQTFDNNRVPIHIVDLHNQYVDYYFDETDWFIEYRGNEYLYQLLANQNQGSFYSIRNELGVIETISRPLKSMGLFDYKAEVILDPGTGYCIEDFVFEENKFRNPLDPIRGLGKCRTDNLSLMTEFEIDDQLFSKEIKFEDHKVHDGTVKNKIEYFGNYIRSLESQTYNTWWPTRQLVEEIIEKSIEYRVLSFYTAFLALEVRLGGFLCNFCVDETDQDVDIDTGNTGSANDSSNDWELANISFGGTGRDGSDSFEPSEGGEVTTSTTEVEVPIEANISAYPNPFNSSIEISIKKINKEYLDNLELSIFDMNGRLVKKFDKNEIASHQEDLIINWDGTYADGSVANNGVYVIALQTPKFKSTLKLVKVNR